MNVAEKHDSRAAVPGAVAPNAAGLNAAAPDAAAQVKTEAGLVLRDATPADVSDILDLVHELALYEKDPAAVRATEADLLRHGFGPEPYFRCIMAEWKGRIAGFALYFFQYSTWEGRPALYLEDLFVRPAFRRNGIGKALFQRLAAIAMERECTRLQWECLDWNTPALEFYEGCGAKVMRDWLNLRMTTVAISQLAGTGTVASTANTLE